MSMTIGKLIVFALICPVILWFVVSIIIEAWRDRS